MNVLWITIPVTLIIAAVFVVAFIVAVKRDHFEDLVTPAHRMLLDDDRPFPANSHHRKDDPNVSEPD